MQRYVRQRFSLGIALVVWLALCVFAPRCDAHPGYPASALVQIGPDGSFIIHVRHDCLAFALNETPVLIGDDPMRELLANTNDLREAMVRARTRFGKLFVLTANGERIEVRVTESPSADAVLAFDVPRGSARLPLMLDFVGEAQLPMGTTQLTLKFPEVMGDTVMTIERPGAEPFSLPLRAGEVSPAIEIRRVAPPVPEDAEQDSQAHDAESAAPAHDETPLAAPMGTLDVAGRYVWLGLTHIVPYGLDHILFVLGLFLLSDRLKPLLWQITSFTLAHSVTLTLATLGWVRLPPDIVEPIIAASIAFVAIENMVTSKLHAWRPMIVFGFGLVHGMGFASVLMDLGLPHGQLAIALVSFNIGVELGQLAVISAALVLVLAWHRKKWYRQRIAIPASVVIAIVAIWWTVQRTFGL